MRATWSPGSAAGRGRIYFDNASNKFRVSENGGGWVDLVGGGGLTPPAFIGANLPAMTILTVSNTGSGDGLKVGSNGGTALSASGFTLGVSATASDAFGTAVWASSSSSNQTMYVENKTGTGSAVTANIPASGWGSTAVNGINNRDGGGAVGVRGTGMGTTQQVYGVYGDVYSPAGFAVYGTQMAAGGVAVYGENTLGGGAGVKGVSNGGTQGYGVIGFRGTPAAPSGPKAGVLAMNNGTGTDDSGLYAIANNTAARGVWAENNATLTSTIVPGAALYISGTVGVSSQYQTMAATATTWSVNLSPTYPLVRVRNNSTNQTVSTLKVTDARVTTNTVVIFNLHTASAVSTGIGYAVYTHPGSFDVVFTGSGVNFPSGDGFNYMLINE
jgi:hypothetical protein